MPDAEALSMIVVAWWWALINPSGRSSVQEHRPQEQRSGRFSLGTERSAEVEQRESKRAHDMRGRPRICRQTCVSTEQVRKRLSVGTSTTRAQLVSLLRRFDQVSSDRRASGQSLSPRD